MTRREWLRGASWDGVGCTGTMVCFAPTTGPLDDWARSLAFALTWPGGRTVSWRALRDSVGVVVGQLDDNERRTSDAGASVDAGYSVLLVVTERGVLRVSAARVKEAFYWL